MDTSHEPTNKTINCWGLAETAGREQDIGMDKTHTNQGLFQYRYRTMAKFN
jgi:hypothetical protein